MKHFLSTWIKMTTIKKVLTALLILFNLSYGLSLNEALKIAKENSPLFKSYKSGLKSVYYTYKTWFSPFLPSFKYNFSYSKYFYDSSSDYFYRNHSFVIDWILYDSGRSIIDKDLLKYTYLSEKENFKENSLDIDYYVKNAYMQCVASYQIVKFRKKILEIAKKNLEIAKKKKKSGLVKKSDILQAQVRYQNAKYQLIRAKSDYKKALAQLNSWLGYPLDRKTKIEEKDFFAYADNDIPPYKNIEKVALEKRPVLKQLKYQIKNAKLTSKKILLEYTPYIYISFAKNKSFDSLSGKSSNYSSYSISLNWNIFSGFSRYYNYLSSKEKERKARYLLQEEKRTIKLKVYQIYTDLKASIAQLEASKTLLEEANINYKQALGEYKVGTGDILSLIRAEESLASAHEVFVNSMLNVALNRIELERQLGVETLKEVSR